jgi:hypothetical protein
MENRKDEAMTFFKEKIFEIFKPIKILHIGSNRGAKDENDVYDYDSDFDIIIVVDDGVDCYEYVKQISPILKQVIIQFNIIISAYPLKERIYKSGESEFLNNLRKNGIEIWKS